MSDQSIFELLCKDNSSKNYVKVFVNWNGKRMSLLEATEILEKTFFDAKPKAKGYGWAPAKYFYESLVKAHENQSEPAKILLYGVPFVVTVSETQDHVIWSRVMKLPTLKGEEIEILDGMQYPDFVFDKKQYYEELEKLRPVYEFEKKLEEEHNRKRREIRIKNFFWNKETLQNDTLDYTSLICPKHLGAIFETYYDDSSCSYQKGHFVRIFVELADERWSLIDILKKWETCFDKKTAGGYTWLPLPALFDELAIKTRHRPFFREVLACGGCGLSGCWPFLIQTRETDDLVIWTNYRQPHRNKFSLGGFWDYSHYPPIVFDKKQYYAELESMRPLYDEYLLKYPRS